jgi:YidC/Oxa1 family membrane protein insertase
MTIPLANIFQPLIDAFDAVLVFFHDSIGFSWGVSIIALTVVVRAALIPLTLKQFKSMQALQRLAPEMKALQERHKDDKQRQQQELMKFYRDNKVNPAGSCLPLVLQLPVFLALFYMLRKDLKVDICGGPNGRLEEVARQSGKAITSIGCDKVDPGSASFLFIHDLTSRATGATLAILLVLYVGSQLLSSVLMSVTADRNQRFIMIALPFVFVPFIRSFPAGLILYWITTNLWTMGQQYIIRRSAGVPVLGAPGTVPAGAAAAVAESPPPARGSRGARAAKANGDGDGAAPARPRSAPPPPPRRRKKKTGRRR